jgi:hypothetical protein
VLRRNFWFCSIDDPSAMQVRDRIGVEHIMVESDYPHADSSWPDTQAVLGAALAGVPDAEVAAMTHGNAAGLFGHPLPPAGWLDEVPAGLPHVRPVAESATVGAAPHA